MHKCCVNTLIIYTYIILKCQYDVKRLYYPLYFRYSLTRNSGRVDILDLINGILGSLVSITAGCFLYHAWEAMFIGAIGSLLACLTMPLFDKMSVDDPVGASSVHGVCGIWGLI